MGESDDASPVSEPGQPVSRRRRYGRRLLKLVVVGLMLLVLLALAVGWLIQSDWARGRVLDLARARVSETLGREVEIGSLEYTLRPLAIVARDVVIPGSRPDEPFAIVPRLRVELRFEGVFQPTLTVERVDIDRPEVWLTFYEDGTSTFPEIETGEGGGRLQVVIGRLVVEEGVIHLDQQEIPLSVDASPVQATVEGPGAAPLAEDHFVARVVAQQVAALLPDAQPWGGSASARAEISPGRVEVTAGLLRGPDLTADFEAVYAFGDDAGPRGNHGEVEIRARGDAALANRLGYLEDPIEGAFRFAGEVQLSEVEGTRYRGNLTSPGIHFLERDFSDITASLSGGDEGLTVEVEEAAYAGGLLVATLTLPAEEAEKGGSEAESEGRPAHVEAEARNLVLARLVDDLELEDSPLAGLRGRAGAEMTYRFDTADPLAGSGEGMVRLAGVERGDDDRLPVSGRVPLNIRNGVVLIEGGRLEAPQQLVTLSGNYDLTSGTGSFQYRLVSENLSRIVQALPQTAELIADGTPPWMLRGGTGTVEGRVVLGPDSYSVEATTELAALETDLIAFDRVRAPLTLENGVLNVRDGLLESGSQRLEVSGSYDLERGSAEGDFRLLTRDLGELGDLVNAVIPAAPEPAGGEGALAARPPWLPTGGEGEVKGRLARTADGSLTGRIELDLADLDLPAASAVPASAAEGTPTSVRLDRLAGSFRLLPGAVRDLRLEATSGAGALLASGSLPLPPGGEPDSKSASEAWMDEPFDLDLDLVDWPLSSLTALAAAATGSAPVEATGNLTLQADLAGTFHRPRGEVTVSAEPFTVAGFAFDRVAAEVGIDGDAVRVERARALMPAGEVRAEGTWNRASGALDGRVASDGIDLAAAPLDELLPGAILGELVLTAEIGGSVDRPSVVLESSTRGLEVDGRILGEDGVARLDATWNDEQLTARGSLLGLVDFSGGGRLSLEAADLSLDLEVADVDSLVRLASGAEVPGLGGTVAGTLTVAGRFDAAQGPDIELALDPVRLTYEGRAIENVEPVELALESGRLEVRSLFVSMPDQRQSGELFVVGSVGLEEPYALDLRAQADLSARWLELLVDDINTKGRLQALTTIGGTVAEPKLNGQGELLDGEVVFASFPHALEELDAVALFYPDRIVLDHLSGRLGGGRLRAEGRLALPGAAATGVTYRLQAQLDDTTLRYPEGFLLRGNANMTMVSSDDGRLISGVFDLERAFYLKDVPVGVTQLLQNVFAPTRLEAGTADPVLAETELNVAIRGPGALRVRNNVADLTGDIDLVVRGNLADPALFGQVELAQGGKLVYSENEYEVDRGLITFANPYRIDPVIDFVATTEVRNYDIILNLSGTLDRLDASFTSDPPLANLEVVSLLTVGRPIGDGALGATGDASAPGGASAAAQDLLYGQAASLLSERVNTLFGFDRFRVSPATGTAGSSGLAVTVGQQISRDVYVTYSRDPALPEVDVVQVEWQVYDNVVVVLTSNGDRTYAVDVQIENRF